MIFHSTFSAQDSEATVRDTNVKFGRDAAWYMYVGHAKTDIHTTTRQIFDQGLVLSSVPNIFTLHDKVNTKKTRSKVNLRFYSFRLKKI